MRLYRFEDVEIEDAWGKPISVRKLVEVVDVDIVGKREYDNGYERAMIDIAEAVQEDRTFSCPIEIDYFGGGNWYEDDGERGHRMYRTAKRLTEERFIDAAGNPFTKVQLLADEESNE